MNETMSVTQSQIALYRAIANSERVDRSKNAADLLTPKLKVVTPEIDEIEDVKVGDPFSTFPNRNFDEMSSIGINNQEDHFPELVSKSEKTNLQFLTMHKAS